MCWRRSWFSLKGKAGIPGQTEGRPATPIALRAPPAGSLQQRDIGEMAPVQIGKPSFKVVIDQRNCQVGRALDQADAKIPQGGPEVTRTGHINRANACTKTLEVFFSGLRWQPEAGPIGRACTSAGARCRKDEPPLEQPPQCFLDLRCREVSFQLAHEFPKARATRYFLRQCTVEFAVKKELPVLGIEADDVGS